MYRFFQQWCPNIHNATDEEESGDDEMTSPQCYATEEEVNAVTFITLNYVKYSTTRKNVQRYYTLDRLI